MKPRNKIDRWIDVALIVETLVVVTLYVMQLVR